MNNETKFMEGDMVKAGSFKLPMTVVSVTPSLDGTKYTLAFYRKDGQIDRRRNYRIFFEKDLNHGKK